jgi:hypothetical protein
MADGAISSAARTFLVACQLIASFNKIINMDIDMLVPTALGKRTRNTECEDYKLRARIQTPSLVHAPQVLLLFDELEQCVKQLGVAYPTLVVKLECFLETTNHIVKLASSEVTVERHTSAFCVETPAVEIYPGLGMDMDILTHHILPLINCIPEVEVSVQWGWSESLR